MIDYALLFGSTEYDPCAVLQAIRPVYMEMLTSPGVKRVKFRDRDTEFQTGDIAGLAGLVAQMESECAAKQGRAKPRFAITAGARRAL
jgi:hypothetical protein